MDSIISILILFFVVSTVAKTIKRIASGPKKAPQQTQAQIEATKPKAPPRPAPKPNDFRFPDIKPKVMPKSGMQPAMQLEGRDPDAVMGVYTPIKPSMDLQNQFSEYQGSLKGGTSEGIGYQPDDFDPVEAQYQTSGASAVKILPDNFRRDTLLQAVVMSEILKRPGAKR